MAGRGCSRVTGGLKVLLGAGERPGPSPRGLQQKPAKAASGPSALGHAVLTCHPQTQLCP